MTGFIKKNGHLKYQNATFRKSNKLRIMCNSPGVYIPSFGIKRDGFSDLSKWLPAISSLVRTILHDVALLIMIGWWHLLCKLSMIPSCHQGIQNLHIHWKYPSGSGVYSHMVRHFPAALPSVAKRSAVASVLFTVTSPQGHVNHMFTIMTLPRSPNSAIFIAPEQCIFHSDVECR